MGAAKMSPIPSDAKFNSENKEWELGASNSSGQPTGLWKYWLEDGHLVCKCEYDDEGKLKWVTRYHQDGTFSQKVKYVDGKEHGIAYYQGSLNNTTEVAIPKQAPKNIFRMEYDWDMGQVKATRHWDINGDEVDQRGAIINPVRRGEIDPKATFTAQTGEWCLESFNDEGVLHGISRFWRTSGTLIEEQRYENGSHVYIRRFHPNGKRAFERRFDPVTFMAVSNTNIACEEETDVNFPRGKLDPQIVKTQYFYGPHGNTVEWVGWDKDGKEIAREKVNRSLDSRTIQTDYATIDEASREWNDKGTEYYRALNRFIDQFYIENSDVKEDEEEPSDQRAHMETYVLQALEKLNKEGNGMQARSYFKPSFEPFCKDVWTGLGRQINKICSLENALIICAERSVYTVVEGQIKQEEGLLHFGVSRNKNYFARAYRDRIDVCEGFKGAVVNSFPYPKNFGAKVIEKYPNLETNVFKRWENLGLTDILVSDTGGYVVLVSSQGIYFLETHRSRLFFPHAEAVFNLIEANGEKDFSVNLQVPCAEIGLDDKSIVMSGQYGEFQPLRMVIKLGENYVGNYTQQDSSDQFFTASVSHPNGKHYLTGMFQPPERFGGGNITSVFTFDAEFVAAQEKSLLANYQGTVSDRTAHLHAACPFGDQFLIGMSDCYLWIQGINENTQKYTFVGGTGHIGVITAITVDSTQSRIYVGTSFGAVWCFKVGEERGTGFVTNMNLIDDRRFIFLKTFEPMIW